VSIRILRGQAQSVAPIAQEHIPCRTQLNPNLLLGEGSGFFAYFAYFAVQEIAWAGIWTVEAGFEFSLTFEFSG
jgi:hypothetical protein